MPSRVIRGRREKGRGMRCMIFNMSLREERGRGVFLSLQDGEWRIGLMWTRGNRNKIVFISWSPDEGALVMVSSKPIPIADSGC